MTGSYRYSVYIKSFTDPDYEHVVGTGLNVNQAERRLMAVLHNLNTEQFYVESREEALA